MLDTHLIEELRKLGFTEQEAAAYITLLTGSPMSGYSVASKTGIPKYHVYEVLESLVKKGCVSVSRNTTSQYIAISYENYLNRFQNSQKHYREEALKQYQKLLTQDNQTDTMWNLYRIQDIYAQLINLIDSAEKTILLKIWAKDIIPLEKSLQGAFRRGVKLYIIVLGEYKNKNFTFYHYPKSEFDHALYPYHSIKSEFDKHIVCCCNLSEETSSYATWTSNPLLFMPTHSSLCIDISIAKLYHEASPEQKELWGEDLINLRKKYL